ncbi:hypothetical protein B0H34DRAFT_671538 [Crassisporium funariophilum]|nr:hypothetical protein B0H34DRAFT_671538 [Crassisporium funariophilum]
MSRLSRANLKARESIFASGPEQYIGDTQARCPPDLEECVMAMEDCCEEATIYRRMRRKFCSDMVFLLVNEDTVKRYKSALADEIEPAITELIERAQQGLAGLEKKEHTLQTKVENAQSRTRNATGTSAAQKLEARRLQTLTKQRERLEAEVRAAEAEVMELARKKGE